MRPLWWAAGVGMEVDTHGAPLLGLSGHIRSGGLAGMARERHALVGCGRTEGTGHAWRFVGWPVGSTFALALMRGFFVQTCAHSGGLRGVEGNWTSIAIRRVGLSAPHALWR